VNTLQKMAQKRAMVGAVLIATRTSEQYTQDLEDFERHEDVPNGAAPSGSPPASQDIYTDEQKELLDKLMKSHVWTEKEKEQAAGWLDNYPSKEEMSKAISSAQATIAKRKVAEKEAEAASGKESKPKKSKAAKKTETPAVMLLEELCKKIDEMFADPYLPPETYAMYYTLYEQRVKAKDIPELRKLMNTLDKVLEGVSRESGVSDE